MKKEEAEFIVETLETAIDWAEYATQYFQEKHNLAGYKEDMQKAIKLMRDFESRTCDNCKYLEDRSSVFYTPIHLARYRCSHPLMNISDGNSDLTYVGLTFMCNNWEQENDTK